MDLQSVGKLLVVVGAVLALAGILFIVGGRLGLGTLPGDIRLHGQGWSCFLPITTSIIVSILLTVLLSLLLRFLGR